MSHYSEKVAMREASAPCEFETSDDGKLVRCLYRDSKLLDDKGEFYVMHGPWCVDEQAARRWWTSSETARHMREGRPVGVGA